MAVAARRAPRRRAPAKIETASNHHPSPCASAHAPLAAPLKRSIQPATTPSIAMLDLLCSSPLRSPSLRHAGWRHVERLRRPVGYRPREQDLEPLYDGAPVERDRVRPCPSTHA